MTTGITWTDETWNPTVGCSLVSPGCSNCYAMKMAHRINRMQANPDSHYFGTTKVVNGKAVWTGKLNLAPDHILLKPLSWKKPRRIFVNSMSDLFHEDVPYQWIDKVFAVMALCPQHTFQVLTKRSKRMREYISATRTPLIARRCIDFAIQKKLSSDTLNYSWPVTSQGDVDMPDDVSMEEWPLPNVHLGVSCEDQTRADERVPDLLATPAAVRFVSAEPLLGLINFATINVRPIAGDGWVFHALRTNNYLPWRKHQLDWIIAGGESGSGFRPMQIEWAESIRQECDATGTAFFFKQDSAHKSGQRGRASDALWACKQFPEVK